MMVSNVLQVLPTANPDIYEILQQEPILDDCPQPDPNIPSVALLYKGMDGRQNEPGLADIDIGKLQNGTSKVRNRNKSRSCQS